jgi:hypothetical protein
MSAKTGTRTYILVYRVKGSRQERYITIGRHNDPWRVDQARAKALEIKSQMLSGVDPVEEERRKEEERRERAALDAAHSTTLRQVLDSYLANRTLCCDAEPVLDLDQDPTLDDPKRIAVGDLAKYDPDAYLATFGSDEPASAEPVVKNKPARPTAEAQNGVRRPLRGVCADTWRACDELLAKGTTPDAATMRQIADKYGWNRNNVSIELSRWRKFHGIARQTKPA